MFSRTLSRSTPTEYCETAEDKWELGIDRTAHLTLGSGSSRNGREYMFDSRTPRCALHRSVLLYLELQEVNMTVTC